MVLVGVMAVKLRFAYTHFKMKRLMSGPSMLADMPSVSVCIPARNETHAMTDCLERVIASTYPKLEIIVLDDSSGDDTSVLIKSFAHAGVRFVEGSALPEGWLGKNHALEGLLHEASGTYILYMDVDTHIKPDTIEQLVAYTLQENASMISVLPRREDGWRASTLFGSLRYYIELLFHTAADPAVASSAWMIHRETLKRTIGGFDGLKSAIQPEAKLAAYFTAQHAYRFLIGTPMLGVAYEKKWSSQIETSIRLLYPVLGSQPIKALVAAGILTLLSAPFFAVIFALITGLTTLGLLAGVALLACMLLYGSFLMHVWNRSWWLGMLLWPYIVVQELVLVLVSMYRYLRGTATWKGRLVRTK